MADREPKPVKSKQEKSWLETITSKIKYSGAGDRDRQQEIDKQTGDAPEKPTSPEPDKESALRKQYLHEKMAGGAFTDSFEEWKKLG